jgi:monofunctional biosynthetic peptidoglycan transglycosylase
MGRGIYGIEAASQSYFNKPAVSLTRAEAATMASCLPNPKNYTVKPLSNYVAGKRQWVMQQMNNLEDDPDIQNIISEQVAKKKK